VLGITTPGRETAPPAGATDATERARPRVWRPILLSGLVFPGLGQAVSGRPWRALFFAASSVALMAAVVARVTHETRRLLPADPDALLDPTLPVTLAVQIHRANASFFLWCTLGILALWAGSVVDLLLPREGRRQPGPERS
jgi:hypothetical protein